VIRLRDTNGDGVADETKVFVPNVDSPRGLVWDHDRLYVMHPPDLSVYIDKDGDGVADESKVLVKGLAFGFKDRPADHTTNGITLGIDGWLYIAVGDFGFMEATGTDGRKLQLRGGGVVRVRPDGTGLELFCRGTRNILEVSLDPLLNGFARDNTNDGGGWDIRLHHFSGLEEHGYPSLYKNFSDEMVQPLADYGGGSGVSGLYLSEPGFPQGFGDALYTADWGTGMVYRHPLKKKGATFEAGQEKVFKVGRVTDLDVDANSRLYISSWRNGGYNYSKDDVGYILRVVPKGYQPEPLPSFAKASGSELVKLIAASPSHRRRQEAQRELLRRGLGTPERDALLAVARTTQVALPNRVAALYGVVLGANTQAAALIASLATDPALQPLVFRALGDCPSASVPDALLAQGLGAKEPRSRLETVVTIARLQKRALSNAVARLFCDEDTLVAHTVERSLVLLGALEPALKALDAAGTDAGMRAAALRVIRRLPTRETVDALLTRMGGGKNFGIRGELGAALARLYFVEGVWTGTSWGTRPDTSGPIYQPETWAESNRIGTALRAAVLAAQGEEMGVLARELGRNKVELDGTLGPIVAAARKDKAVIPSAVAQLAKAQTVPADAASVMIAALGDRDLSMETRLTAVAPVLTLDSETGMKAAMALLAESEQVKKLGKEFVTARNAWIQAPKLENYHTYLETEAAKVNGAESLWAEVGVIALAGRKRGSPESREQAGKSLEAGWAKPARKVQILQAIARGEFRGELARVEAALDDPDPKVNGAAQEAAKKVGAKKKEKGVAEPMIATLKTDDVIKAVAGMKGDAKLGEQLFARQGCAACHTVNQNDPPKGPYLGNIASMFKRGELAEAILLPNKTLAQGFVTTSIELKDGSVVEGFVIQEAADRVQLRNIAAQEITVETKNIKSRRKIERSLMPEGLVAGITVKELAGLVSYLESLGGK
jgi:putative heme-binding domain-containing protein